MLREGKKLDLLPERMIMFCFEMDYDHEMIPGKNMPVLLHSSFRYASVVGRGHCEIITDVDEKIRHFELLMKHQTGRRFCDGAETYTGS